MKSTKEPKDTLCFFTHFLKTMLCPCPSA